MNISTGAIATIKEVQQSFMERGRYQFVTERLSQDEQKKARKRGKASGILSLNRDEDIYGDEQDTPRQ